MLVKIHMSNYTEKHSIACLIGAGDIAGQLTEPVRNQPCSVILFEDVDMAHVAVCDVLLQVHKDGRLTDGQGRTVDFTNTIIIMTSTLGSKYLLTKMPGYTSKKVSHDLVLQEVKKHFREEFLDKIGKTLILNPLSRDPLREVASRYLKEVGERFAKKGIALHITDAALDVIIAESDDPDDHVYGARNIQRSIEERVTDELVMMFVRNEIVENSTVYVDVAKEKDELVYRVE
ncbi:Chaperone protein ClpB [Rhynchospora pubera]|uniref:Chaperone protein ClpB n=1 Tax=Rhynchospora pubera TaxID=906938 RepID=A0AAV8FVA6_9POAL|nr:Chaperone protein ClpB [Rhynchospora pubera]